MKTEPEQLSQNLWERYGFSGDPFDTNPLPISYGNGLSVVNAYVPRVGKLNPGTVMTNFFKNPGGGRIVVEGEPGVGKTTFVNYHRYEWEHHAKQSLISPVSYVSVQRHWKEEDFLLHLLSSLSARIRLEMRESEFAKDKLLKEVSAITGVCQEEDGGIGLSLSFLGTGGGFNKTKGSSIKVGAITSVHLRDYLTKLVARVHTKLGSAGVIFHLDNLELLKQAGDDKLQTFFEDIRDAIQEPNVYFIFVGYREMFQEVIVPSPRVRSIFFDTPLMLEPLSREQVHEIIARRYEILRAPEKNWIKPVDDTVIDYLYDMYEGKIRYVMNAVTSLISHIPDSYADTLSLDKASELLQAIQFSELKGKLTAAEIEVLLDAVPLRRFTPTELCNVTGKSKQSIQKYLQKFLEGNYVYQTEKVGRRQYYKVEPRYHILVAATEREQSHASKTTKLYKE